MCPCLQRFELGLGGVGTWYDGLAHIDSAGLMFAESVEGLVDQAGTWGLPMNKSEVRLMNFPTLLHFSEEGGVLFAPCHQEKAGRLAVESADERKEFIGILVAEPVDEGERSIGSGGVDEPASRFIDDQKRGVFEDNGGLGIHEGKGWSERYTAFEKNLRSSLVGSVIPNGPCRAIVHGRLGQPPLPAIIVM